MFHVPARLQLKCSDWIARVRPEVVAEARASYVLPAPLPSTAATVTGCPAHAGGGGVEGGVHHILPPIVVSGCQQLCCCLTRVVLLSYAPLWGAVCGHHLHQRSRAGAQCRLSVNVNVPCSASGLCFPPGAGSAAHQQRAARADSCALAHLPAPCGCGAAAEPGGNPAAAAPGGGAAAGRPPGPGRQPGWHSRGECGWAGCVVIAAVAGLVDMAVCLLRLSAVPSLQAGSCVWHHAHSIPTCHRLPSAMQHFLASLQAASELATLPPEESAAWFELQHGLWKVRGRMRVCEAACMFVLPV